MTHSLETPPEVAHRFEELVQIILGRGGGITPDELRWARGLASVEAGAVSDGAVCIGADFFRLRLRLGLDSEPTPPDTPTQSDLFTTPTGATQ